METDSFFCQLLKQLPQTLFELIGQSSALAQAYDFQAVEIKKSLRMDGLFLPKKPDLPVYFVEVKFQRLATFYANLFAKVFLFMEANPTAPDWAAVAIFESRQLEPKHLRPFEDLLESKRVTRIYLDEYKMPADPPVGLGVLQLMTAPKADVRTLVERLDRKAKSVFSDSEMQERVIQLAEELLIRRFAELTREEIRKMFGLQDIRKTKVWQEAREEGREEGRAEGREEGETRARQLMVQNCLASGMSLKEIADLMKITVREVRRLSK